jgi:hypothetical protein
MVIALLLRNGRRDGVEISRNHVGKNGARLCQVELAEREIHAGLPNLLVASHKLCVDRANLVERSAQRMQVADELSDPAKIGIAHVISVRSAAGLADR